MQSNFSNIKSIRLNTNKLDLSTQKLLNWFVYFITFPVVLVLGQNISVFFFIVIWNKLKGKNGLLKLNHKAVIFPILFAIGALISVFDVNAISSNSFSNSMQVLPNYIYWSLMVTFLVKIKDKLKIYEVAKFTMFGVISTIIYYSIQSIFLPLGFLFNRLTPNSFSFILICFSTALLYLFVQIK